MIAVTFLALLLLQAPFSPPPQQGASKSSTATLEGFVFRAGSGEPLARAQVTLVRVAPGRTAVEVEAGSVSAAPLTAATGADGKFVFINIEPGSYRIAVARNGYARQEYGQRVFAGQGRVITLAPGQSMTGIAFQLLPTGSVSGVVKDASGEPLAGAQVQLLRSSFNSFGQRAFQAVGGDRTNDRGEYRMYWITPGRYYIVVVAAAPSRAVVPFGTAGSPNEIVERPYPTVYHPGTIDVLLASAVDVQPGVELSGVDFAVPQPDLFRVRGRLFDANSGRQPDTASLSIVERGSTAGPVGYSGSTAKYNPVDGSFEVRDVSPGTYWLRATVGGKSPDAVLPPSAAGRSLSDVFVDSLFSDRRATQIPLEVFADIDGLMLTLGSGVSIPGSLVVEGRSLSAIANLDNVQVTLRPMTMGMIANPSRHRPIGRDGAFTLPNVLPGEYVVSVQSLPADYYVKEARIDYVDALDRLVVSGPVRGPLSVVLGPAGGRIDGTVTDDRGRTVPGIQAVLVPARRPARADLYKTVITDGAGRFVIRGIPPGDYRVFAWEALEAFGYFDEDFLRATEAYSASVRVSDSSTTRLEVKIIGSSPQ